MNTVFIGTRSPDSNDEQSVTEAVVDAVADAEGVQPSDVTPPLATVLDPDALEAVVESVGENRAIPTTCVEFTYSGYRIAVSTDGSVDLSEC